MSDFLSVFILFIIMPLFLCLINSCNENKNDTTYETCND